MIIQPPDEIAIAQQPTLPMVLEQEEGEQRPATLIAVEEQEEGEQQSSIPVTVVGQDEVGQEPAQAMLVQEEVAEQPTQLIVVLQDKAEEQPTQAIVPVQDKAEGQPTQLMVVVRYRAQQKPKQAIALGQARIAEQTTQLMVVVQRAQQALSRRMWRWFVPILMCLVLLGGIVGGIAALHIRVPVISAIHKILIPSTHIHNPKTALSRANSLAAQFMDAMMHKDWAGMWSMLDPDAQQSWQGENDFIRFEQAKFGALKFISFKASTASVQQSWLDPDTTQIYASAAIVRVSLVASVPEGLLSVPSNLALNQGLFNNTLFAMTRVNAVWKVLVAGPADLEAPILVPASPPAVKLLVPIFMYHHISNKPTHNVLDYGLTVTTTDFNQQLSWLQQHGYHSISQTELFDALYYGKVLPPHAMILTFDDGYEDAYTDALPVLQAHHYRGIFYIITGMIGGSYLTWGQVYKLYLDGMQISSHTVHHINVGEPPAPNTTQEELTVSKQTLETLLGQPVQFFCYPSGEPFHLDSVAERQVVLKDLFEDGYVSATLDPFSIFSAIQNAQLPYELNRVRVSGGEPLNAYIGILTFTLQQGARLLQAS